MLPMSRRTYRWLTTTLMGLSAILFFGSIAALQTDWLQRADSLIQLAVFPGGLIAGGVIVLINGCVEHHADVLPPKYRARRSSRPEWEDIYDTTQMRVVETILRRFARSHGFRTRDSFQFGPEDRLEELMREFYPGRSDADDLLRKADLTSTVADAPTQLSLREYVERLRLAPFSSISELRAIRKAVPGFSKKRYRARAEARRVHGRLMTVAIWLQTAVLWSFISPLILLFQTLPEKDVDTRICQGAG